MRTADNVVTTNKSNNNKKFIKVVQNVKKCGNVKTNKKDRI